MFGLYLLIYLDTATSPIHAPDGSGTATAVLGTLPWKFALRLYHFDYAQCPGLVALCAQGQKGKGRKGKIIMTSRHPKMTMLYLEIAPKHKGCDVQ
jgi:hypothetical protein